MSTPNDKPQWTVNWPALVGLLVVVVVIGILWSWVAAAAAAVVLILLLLLNRIGRPGA
jgi:hypothetical protein